MQGKEKINRKANESFAIGKGFSKLDDDGKIAVQIAIMEEFGQTTDQAFTGVLRGERMISKDEAPEIERIFARHGVKKSDVWGTYTKKPKKSWIGTVGSQQKSGE